jgi:HemK-like putative methylase
MFLTRCTRPDTESYTLQAAKLIQENIFKDQSESAQRIQSLRILDLCTGTGCIALLLHAVLSPHCEQMQISGIDISPKALNLARSNLRHNLQRGQLAHQASDQIEFHQADVLGRGDGSIPGVEDVLSKYARSEASIEGPDATFDLLISNPPYISTSDFRDGTTSRSVRLFEPKLALVPPTVKPGRDACGRPEDIFYAHILALSLKLRPRLTVLECGDLEQARRVVDMHNELKGHHSDGRSVEVWPSTEQDLAAHGFHPHDGSRCVILRRT